MVKLAAVMLCAAATICSLLIRGGRPLVRPVTG
jgi:hypothetical protein